MAANAYHRVTGDQRAADFGLEVAEWMIKTYQWSSDRAPGRFRGRLLQDALRAPAMQAFCYAEGTAAAYDLALRMDSDWWPFFERATRESARPAPQMQFDPAQTYAFTRDHQLGRHRLRAQRDQGSIDYVYHAFSAVYQYLMTARNDPQLPPEEGVSHAEADGGRHPRDGQLGTRGSGSCGGSGAARDSSTQRLGT